jgi:two-component system NtrC family sensor kinase
MLNDVSGVPDPVKDLRVARVVTDVLTLFRYQIPVAIKLNEEIPEELRWPLPESGLRQIILNLLLNAAQSIGEGPGTITIAARTEADAIIVNVSDDGPGFPDELLQQGIRRFSTHKVRGTGIGLSLVQRFVRDLSGQLELSNLRPRGASVSLRLPRRGIYDDRCIVTN